MHVIRQWISRARYSAGDLVRTSTFGCIALGIERKSERSTLKIYSRSSCRALAIVGRQICQGRYVPNIDSGKLDRTWTVASIQLRI